MSKSCTKEKNKHRKSSSVLINKEKTKNKQTNSTIHIGNSNVKLWNSIKSKLNYTCDSDFTSFLLKLAQKHIE